MRLMELHAAAEQWDSVLRVSERLFAVDPLSPGPHRLVAHAADQTGDHSRATASLRALLQMDPLDRAELHHRLAVHLQIQEALPEARRHVLKALEAAPRYREAYRTLLEIVQQMEELP
jgi:tetratricopeptide (TPR) repeat protein